MALYLDFKDKRWRLVFRHHNSSNRENEDPGSLMPKGSHVRYAIWGWLDKHGYPRAKTTALLQLRDGDQWVNQYSGSADCSWFDNFSKKEGRKIAMKRLANQVAQTPDREILPFLWEGLKMRR